MNESNALGGPPSFLYHLFLSSFFFIAETNHGALADQAVGDTLAEAVGAARDDGHLTLKTRHAWNKV